MQTTIVKARHAYDFLALVPQLVGFQPENSMVLVAFRGNRTCGALRFNLPGPECAPKVHKRIATTLIGTLCKIPGVDAVVPVVYTASSCAAVVGLPHERFVTSLVKRAELSGFLVRDALCVGADGWGSYLDPRCPEAGRPLADIAASTVHTAIPTSARRGLGTLHSGTELPLVSPAERERVARACRRYRRFGAPADSAELLPVTEVLNPIDTAEEALTWDASAPTPEQVAKLLFLVQAAGDRDQVMLQFAFGREVGVLAHAANEHYRQRQEATGRDMDDLVDEEQAAGTNTEVRRIGDLMLGLTEDRPVPERIECAIALLKRVVSSAPRSARPAPLCMLAWLSWALGRGTVAGIFIDQALALDPEYGMGILLNTLVCSGLLPEWAYAVPLDQPHDER